MAAKKCTRCGITKDISEFYIRRMSKDGHSAGCGQCLKSIAKKRTPEYRRQERERLAAKQCRVLPPVGHKRLHPLGFNEICLDDLSELNARQAWSWWLKVGAPDKWMAAYFQAAGTPWLNPRLTDAEQYRIKYSQCPEFQISERIRRQVNKKKKRDGIGDVMRAAIKSGGKSCAVERSLGYSIAVLKAHIERQFTKGMNWTLFLDGQIHIDHIIPQAQYDLSNDEDWKACWALSNLMPLWSKDNLKKRDNVLYLL